MKNFPKVLSLRHFQWLARHNSHFLSLKNVVFLVKDVTTQVFSWTQYYNPSVKPIAAYLHGFDVTKFLTYRPTLTAYSYYFINYVYAIGFSARDVRSYFNGFTRVSSREPDTKLLQERGVRKRYLRSAVAESAKTSAQLADESNISLDTTSPGYLIFNKKVKNPGSTTIQKNIVDKRFEDSRIFTCAWKLACSNLLPFKFADSRLELYARLKVEKFGADVLKRFYEYLKFTFGNIDLVPMINDMARQFGYSSSLTRSNVELVRNSFCLLDMTERGLDRESLSKILFPDEFMLPILKG